MTTNLEQAKQLIKIIRQHRLTTGEEHPQLIIIWDKIIRLTQAMTSDEKQDFDDYLD